MLIASVVLLAIAASPQLREEDLPPPIPAEKFSPYFEAVKPYAGEWRWRDEIPWVGTIHEARSRAAKEDKPILAWMSANSPPLGAT